MAPSPPPERIKKRPAKGASQKTLGSLLRHFVDTHLTVELKNGKQFRGILLSAEESMSMMLGEAIELGSGPNEESNYFSALHIRGSNIRYVHFPKQTNLVSTIKRGKEREREAANKYKRGIRKKYS